MGTILWLSVWAWAAELPVSPTEVHAHHEALASLDVMPEILRRVPDEGLSFEEGSLRFSLDSGWMIPVVAGESGGEVPEGLPRGPHLVGFAWVGEGTVGIALDHRADALGLANRVATTPGEVPADLARVARGEAALGGRLEAGIFLSIDPALTQLFHDPVLAEDTPDPLELIVYDDPAGRAAARRATRMFRSRAGLYEDVALPVDRLAWDLAASLHEVGPEQGTWSLVDLQTDLRFGGVTGSFSFQPGADRWVTRLRDVTGLHDGRHEARVFTMGRTDGGVPKRVHLGYEPFPLSVPEDPASPPAAPARFVLERAEGRIEAGLSADELTLPVQIRTRLRLRAVGGDLQWTLLQLPRQEVVPRGWAVESLTTVDGVSVIADEGARGAWQDDLDPWSAYDQALAEQVAESEGEDADEGEPSGEAEAEEAEELRISTRSDGYVPVRIVLPEPVAAGETVELELRLRDVWPYAQRPSCGPTDGSPASDQVKSSGLQDWVPRVGTGWNGQVAQVDVDVRVGDDWLQVVGPGEPFTGADGQAWTAWPSVAVGRWRHQRTEVAPPQAEVRLYRNPDKLLQRVPREVRQIAKYYKGWMPPLPVERLLVVHEPSRCPEPMGWRNFTRGKIGRYGGSIRHVVLHLFRQPVGCNTWWAVAPRGVLPLPRFPVDAIDWAYREQTRVPFHSPGVLAHQVAHQYWGHLARPAHEADFWIAESLAEAYACMYVGAAYGVEACEARMARAREHWEQRGERRTAPLTSAHETPHWDDIVWMYGPYVMLEMLRPRLGNDRFFLALDVLLREQADQPVTTERLQAYLEAASGQELDDFFDYWVHQGRVPSVDLQWSWDGEQVHGVVRSDVPYGTFDVPVVVNADGEAREVWVDVVDGEGRFSVPAGKGPSLSLDPDGRILARARTVTRVGRLE